jgi:polyribonucleotide nucleotidyltransferase
MKKTTYTTDFAGKTLKAEFSDLAEQADGSILISYGETVILVTAVLGKTEPNLNYFPLSVEYEEKFYAAGEILGSRFMRREGRPSDDAILSARIVDRTIRPLFPPGLKASVQVVITVLAVGDDAPDVLAVIGASLALGVSPIPWHGPVSASRVITTAEREIFNPTYSERDQAGLTTELVCCGQNGTINMIEAAASEIPEAQLTSLLEAASALNDELNAWQKTILEKEGKPKLPTPTTNYPEVIQDLYREHFAEKLEETIFSNQPGKAHITNLENEFITMCRNTAESISAIEATDFFAKKIDEVIHQGVVNSHRRADGRGLSEVRPLYAKAGGISPVLHGSGIFYRGGTHIFTALTLGGPDDAQIIDTMEERAVKKRFMHHYNFPPFSVGETGRVGGFNRRMIGHGALAEKALLPVLPNTNVFPYTIRLVSETMASNGSSSMGSVCASSLALLDGGVPITRSVAGIASGLMTYDGKYALLTDIQGPEDEFGDIDFKVAGTTVGITAIQMDVKLSGVPIPILAEALEQAKTARLKILEVMSEAISQPRESISPRAPRIIALKINPDQIGLVIGSGGKTINQIKDQSGVQDITIEDDGTVYITGQNDTPQLAARRIEALTKRYAIGDKTDATITKLMPFGAFARLDDYNEGLIHISEIANFRVEDITQLLKNGDTVPVVVTKVEEGKIGLSIKQAAPDFIKPI